MKSKSELNMEIEDVKGQLELAEKRSDDLFKRIYGAKKILNDFPEATADKTTVYINRDELAEWRKQLQSMLEGQKIMSSSPIDLKPEILKQITGQFYLQENGEAIPVCKGCFNERGPCGTPCESCKRHNEWNEKFVMFMYFPNLFTIYKRRNKK